MKKLIFLINLLMISLAQSDGLQGQQSFKQNCATCHGKQGEKMAMGKSQIIRDMDKESFMQSLQLRQQGLVQGGGNRAKARLTQEEMEKIAEFLNLQ